MQNYEIIEWIFSSFNKSYFTKYKNLQFKLACDSSTIARHRCIIILLCQILIKEENVYEMLNISKKFRFSMQKFIPTNHEQQTIDLILYNYYK